MLLSETPTATTVFRNTTKLKAILKCRKKCFIRLLSFCGSAVKTTRTGGEILGAHFHWTFFANFLLFLRYINPYL